MQVKYIKNIRKNNRNTIYSNYILIPKLVYHLYLDFNNKKNYKFNSIQ
jgi:hypothetical protein